uniref:Uncharacterized protein n=1 Tax=Aegilops tauschii subsp. strangulata TaxID=200361 RepID=A0A453HBD6_AEGTS
RSKGRGGDDVALPDTERKPNILLRCVAFLEWVGHACGALSFLWATVVMLGGFCTLLEPSDFWSTTAIIFIEAFR